MSLRTCPTCGSEYIASVERCVDCDVELIDAGDGVDRDATDVAESDQVTYELIGYANETKVYLDGVLTRADIPHVWQAGDLVVRATDRAAVDPLIEEAAGLEDPVEPGDEVVYEIVGFDEGQRSDLAAMLAAEGIDHSWDDDDLVVRAEDEERVAPILDRIAMADELTADEVEDAADDGPDDEEDGGDNDDGGGDDDDTDGLAAQSAMSDLFVVVDKLMKDPGDRGLRTALAATSERVGELGIPFGFSAANWHDLQERAAALVALTESDERDDDQVKTDARTLREVLHQYV